MAPSVTSASRHRRESGTNPNSMSAIPNETTSGSADGSGRWKSSWSAIADEDSDHERAGEQGDRDDPQLEGQSQVAGGGVAVEHAFESLRQAGPVEPDDEE